MLSIQSNNAGGQKIPIFFQESTGRDSGGFTLVEIIVVVSLIALLLVFSFPRLSGFLSINNKNQLVRWVIIQRTVLKTKAIKEQTPFALRVDISEDRMTAMAVSPACQIEETLFPEDETRPDEKKIGKPFICKGNLEITGVLFPDGEPVISRAADIVFSEKGFCDRAIIYMKDGGDRFSIYIAPFLPSVSVYDGYISFGEDWGGRS